MKSLIFKYLLFLLGTIVVLSSCTSSGTTKTTTDPATGNDQVMSTATGSTVSVKNPGKAAVLPFDKFNLVYIEGGSMVIGSFNEDPFNPHDNIERTVTVKSFYIDKTEIANIHWLEYVTSLKDSGEVYQFALPDTNVWLSELAFNDYYRDNYFRYSGFRFYPVVGVTWHQAYSFCNWRTEKIKEKYGVEVKFSLPKENQWEYAATAMVNPKFRGVSVAQFQKRIYPWNGNELLVRNPYKKQQGLMLANFRRGKGDYAGINGNRSNDGSFYTESIYAYPPNDFGLYNMAGNVSEWCNDLYEPMTYKDQTDLTLTQEEQEVQNLNNPTRFFEKYGLLAEKSRVYKGGSWRDEAYWMAPVTRRYLNEDSCMATLGFRCVYDLQPSQDSTQTGGSNVVTPTNATDINNR